MIKELGWYFETDRFQNIVKDFQEAIHDYIQAGESGDAQAADEKREAARRLFERHAVMSGLRNSENSFINIDAEFFGGGVFNQTAFDTFTKEIIKAHLYQKHLWEFMSTTGSMTVISRSAMKADGFAYDDYLPVSYRSSHKKTPPSARNVPAGEIPYYIYSDGTVSSEYIPDKSKLSFDMLRDTSGFDWNRKGYDPNYTVEKKGWHGAFDSKGTWLRVNSIEQSDMAGAVTQKKPEPIELIRKDRTTAILYDPGFLLLNPAELWYLTLQGEVYGSEKTDISATTTVIAEAMKQLGVKHIICAAGYGKNAHDRKLKVSAEKRYREILGPLASEDFSVTDGKTALIQKEKTIKASEAEQTKHKVSRLIKISEILSSYRIRGNALYEALASGKAEFPVTFRNTADRTEAGISEKEYRSLSQYRLSGEQEESFNRTVMNLASIRKALEPGGTPMETLFEKAYAKTAAGKSPEGSITIEQNQIHVKGIVKMLHNVHILMNDK